MRASTALKLLPACCGLLLSGLPASVDAVTATKAIFDYRTGEDFGTEANCVDAYEKKTRYLQIELFDYNKTPDLELTWKQITDECGNAISNGFSSSMSWAEGDINTDRLQMDMYICVPWGNYELTIISKSTNDGNSMERIAWEVEYGPKEYHIYDTLNTPFYRENPPSIYAPIPSGNGDIPDVYMYPLDGAEGYYSVMYSGPFPPLQCSNLYPAGVDYVGCFDAGLFGTASGPSGSENDDDAAEPYRMFDGIDDDGVNAEGVMTLQKCATKCRGQGTKYFGLESAIKCLCGDELDDSLFPDEEGEGGSVCGIDYTTDVNIPEYEFLCSGDSRVLCGTDDHISVYSLDGSVPAPTPEPETPITSPNPTLEPETPVSQSSFTSLGCAADSKSSRVMEVGPIAEDPMSAEICLEICLGLDPTYTHFGTQYGGECFCTGDLGTTSSSTSCTMSCEGNSGEICGGFDAISVYAIDSNIDPTPTPVTVVDSTPAPVAVVDATPAPVTVVDPVTPGAANGFSLVGCAVDGVSARILSEGPFKADVMSGEVCFDICLEELPTVTHFGTENANECFCGDDLGATSASTACTSECLGNTSEICGGFNAILVYEVEDPVTTPATPPSTSSVLSTPSDYTSLGCFPDLRDGSRAMELKLQASEMSAEICYDLCLDEDAGFEYFGTQYGSECWCSMTFSEPTADGVCDYDCAGNPSETCGGFDAISAFSIN
ncbi:unnamed protein product [Pylaiella littoralis]